MPLWKAGRRTEIKRWMWLVILRTVFLEIFRKCISQACCIEKLMVPSERASKTQNVKFGTWLTSYYKHAIWVRKHCARPPLANLHADMWSIFFCSNTSWLALHSPYTLLKIVKEDSRTCRKEVTRPIQYLVASWQPPSPWCSISDIWIRTLIPIFAEIDPA
jgi:hypothetical protein